MTAAFFAFFGREGFRSLKDDDRFRDFAGPSCCVGVGALGWRGGGLGTINEAVDEGAGVVGCC